MGKRRDPVLGPDCFLRDGRVLAVYTTHDDGTGMVTTQQNQQWERGGTLLAELLVAN